ncbi:ATP synthase subunit g [Colletotrichum chrysophilum]|uniref:ATP synthase subunit g n=1 Tax=Colletotrichum chrysophilum TaxID=1836956 RepID=A0AAD9AJF9_9PEZI|nr:ATP synthase subunit g [Colletotrichum chrysophilum]
MEGVAHRELSVVIELFFFSCLFRVGATGQPQLGQQHSTNDTAATAATATATATAPQRVVERTGHLSGSQQQHKRNLPRGRRQRLTVCEGKSSFFPHAKIPITTNSPPPSIGRQRSSPLTPGAVQFDPSPTDFRSTGFVPPDFRSFPSAKMSSALARPLMRTTARTLPSRAAVRFESTASKKATDATKDAAAKASEYSAKAAQGLSRAASAAGPAISGAVNALGKVGGRTGKVIGFIEKQVPWVVYYSRVGLELSKIVFHGQKMAPP